MVARIYSMDDAPKDLINELLPEKLTIVLNRTEAEQFLDLLLDGRIYSPTHGEFATELRVALLDMLGIEEL